jgi:hypothetical protein
MKTNILEEIRHTDKLPFYIRELSNIHTTLGDGLARAGDEIESLQNQLASITKERDDLVDTFAAIYDSLGITEDAVDGKEKVSVTVKRYIDNIITKHKQS